MKRTRTNVGLLALTIIFVLPSTFELKPLAIPVQDFYVTFVELCVMLLLWRWGIAALIRRDRARAGAPFDVWMIALLGAIAVSGLVGLATYDVKKVLGDARQYIPLFLYFWAMRDLAREDRVQVLRKRIFQVLVVVAAYVLIAFFFFRPLLAEYARENAVTAGSMEARVFFDNTLLLVFVYSGYLLHNIVESRGRALFSVAVLLLNVAMLLVMQVRSYWIAFLAILLMTGWAYRTAFFRARLLAIGGAATAALLAVVLGMSIVRVDVRTFGNAASSITDRAASLVNVRETFLDQDARGASELETIGTRWETGRAVVSDYILENPIFGIGLGGELPMVDAAGNVTAMNFMIDNGYLTLLAKFGVVGFALYAVILLKTVTLLRSVLRAPSANTDERALARALLAGIVGALIASMSSSILVRQQPSILAFLIVLAETTVLARRVRKRQELRNPDSSAIRSGVCGTLGMATAPKGLL